MILGREVQIEQLNRAILSLKTHLSDTFFICGGELGDGSPCICVYVERLEYAEKSIPLQWEAFPVKICLNR